METTEVNEWGSIHISQRVIASIAALTAAKAAYVADLGMNIAEAAAEKLGRTLPGRGVDVTIVTAVHIIVQQLVFEEDRHDG